MGWLGDWLAESELKLFGPLAENLSKVAPGVRVDKAEIGCSKQIGLMHIGIGIWFPDGEKLYLHRCMNQWIHTNNTVGMDPSPFFMQFTSRSEAELLLTELILDTMQAKRTRQNLDQETELESSWDIDEVRKTLRDLYLGSGAPQNSTVADEVALLYSEKWADRVEQELGGERNEKVGSILNQGSIPSTSHGRGIAAKLKSRSKSIVAHVVTREELVAWWDRTAQHRQFVIVLHDLLIQLETERNLREEGGEDAGPQSQWAELAYLNAVRTTPVFEYWTDEEYAEAAVGVTPLPWEMYNRVTDFRSSREQDDPQWFGKAIEAGSFNAYFRLQNDIDI